MRITGCVLPDLSRAGYDALVGENFSRLKNMARSARHYQYRSQTPRTDTPALSLGRAVHLAVLEPEKFSTTCVRWDGGTRRGKEWDAFRERHGGREILTADEDDLCADISSAVLADPIARHYVTGGAPEVSVLWTHDEQEMGELPGFSVECKARLDYVRPDCLVDLKTCRDASQEGFGREAWRLQYHVQAAYYRDGYAAATGRVLPFFIVAVEKDAPHVCQVFRVTENLLDLGRDSYLAMLRQLDQCKREGTWPGYSEGELELMPPRWALPDDDAGDLGLDFGEVA